MNEDISFKNNDIARPAESRLTEKVDFWIVHYNRSVYQFVCPSFIS